MRKLHIFLFITLATVMVSCKKESATPGNPQPAVATFSVASVNGNCENASVGGTYNAGVALNSNNQVLVQVNVTKAGTYTVATSAVNGLKFTGSGTFTTTGLQNITLMGTGTPVNGGTTTIPFFAGYSSCNLKIFVIAAPIGALPDNDHMLMGNPSNAVGIIDSGTNYLMRKTYYSVSYNKDRGTANWISWHLFNDDLGPIPRQDDYRPDDELPASWYHVSDASYSSTGFDRGHNCPSGDRTNAVAANSATFLMTNMIPQAPHLNQQPWEKMEDSIRRLITLGNEVYVIMGVYGTGGTGDFGFASTIDNGNVTVPAHIWKIAVVIPNGNGDVSRINSSIRVIAVDMPNTVSVTSNWKNYRVSIDAIEAATGYDLLTAISTSLQTTLEAGVDNL